MTPPAALRAAIAGLAADLPGTFVEDKNHCIALHDRLGDAARTQLRASLAQAIADHAPGWDMIDGHRVFEIKPASVNKGSACRALLREPAFLGRIPLYLGDDTTDVDAFDAVRAVDGVPVAVGPRVARHAAITLGTPTAARAWLVRLCSALDASATDVARLIGRPA
jgi:trehalose 6-phosphate phosphatase